MEIQVLGPVELRDNGVEVPVGGPRQRRLLAALVVNAGKVVSVDRLIDAVWAGEEPPEQAANTMRTYVSRLRATLGDGLIQKRDPGYSLVVDPEMVDATRFERLLTAAHARLAAGDATEAKVRLDEALALWNGPAYDEFASESWVWADAARLEELRLSAREDRAEALLLRGDTEAVGELERLTVEFPLRERSRHKLMLALYRDGRQADALRSFQTYRTHLAEEVGLEPSGELVELEHMIATRDPRLDEQPAPRALRGYLLGQKLGEGRFGVVYRATQLGVGRDVAVKVIHPDLADDPVFVRRFENEAQLVARLEHPHIVPLYDFWREPGGAYLVMRWLRGGTVEDRLVDGPLDLDETMRIVDQVGGALSAAHHAGVVHRDIKPGNLLLDDEGNVYLSDFGIAVAPPVGGDLADVLRSAGSPVYASPEQMAGQAVTPRSDIYSLGVLTFELLTGQLPYRSQTVTSLIGEKLARPAPALSSQRPDLPHTLDLVLQRATMPEADGRYGSVAELVDALHAAIATADRMATTDEIAPERPARVAGRGAHVTMAALAIAATNPYKGLRSFDEADAADFFGRARLVEQLVSELHDSRFLAVVGPSGSGKSSVVRAGLVPALRDGAVPGSSRWFVTTMVPGRRPFEELESALLRVAINPPASLLEQLRDGERGMARAVRRSLPSDTTELVLVVDQFEELFTQVDGEERDHFLAAMASAVGDGEARLRVVATVRADYFDRPLTHRSIGELMAGHHVAITPLSADELERAVAGPAERAGARLEPGLLAAIVADVSERPAALPLLQYCLTELYDRRDGLVMTLAAYRELGGVSGALGRRAEEEYESLDDKDRLAARELFTRLVTPGEGAADTRRRARRSEVLALPVGTEAMEHVLGSFGKQRLLTFDRDPATREPTVELGHEALLTEWPRLKAWVDEDREGLRVMRRVAEASEAWVQGGREEADLLRGARLEAASEWAAANPERLAADEQDFVAASTAARDAARARERRATRRLHRLIVGVSAALVFALVAGAIAVAQRNEATDQRNRAREAARDAQIGEMAAQARTLAGSNNRQALLLALEADRLRPDADTLGALEVALLARPEQRRTVSSGVPFINVVGSLDGRTISGGTSDGRLVQIDVESGRTLREWKVSDGLVGGVLNEHGGIASPLDGSGDLLVRDPDGAERTLVKDGLVSTLSPLVIFAGSDAAPGIAVATRSGVRMVDVASGETLRTFAGYAPGWLSMSADGRRLAIESNAAPWTVTTIDTHSGDPVGPVVTAPWPATFALNRSGDRLAIAFNDEARLVDVATGNILGTPLPGNNFQVVFSADGSLMAATGQSRDVRVFNSATGATLLDLKVDFGGAAGLVFSPDRSRLLVVSPSGDVATLDLVGDTKLARPVVAEAGYPEAFSPDGSLAAVLDDNDVALIDVGSARVVRVLQLARHDQPVFAAFGPDGAMVAVGSAASDGLPAEIELFSTEDGRSERRLRVSGASFQRGTIGPSAWSPDGRVIALGFGGQVIRVDSTSGERLDNLALPGLVAVEKIAYAPDGRLLVAGDEGIAFVFDRSGRATRTYAPPDHHYLMGMWRPDGTLVLPDYDTGEVRVVDPVTNRQTGAVYAGPAGFADVTVGPDGRGGLRGVSTSDGNVIRLWDVATGQPIGVPIEASSTAADHTVANFNAALTSDAEHHRMILWDLEPTVWRVRACEAAGRNLTRDEWQNFLPDGEPYHVTCPQYPAGA